MDRRTSLSLIAASGAAPFLARSALAQGARASGSLDPYAYMRWGRGFEGQRRADLGNGTFLNPSDNDRSFQLGGRGGATETSNMAPYWPFRFRTK